MSLSVLLKVVMLMSIIKGKIVNSLQIDFINLDVAF